MEDAGSDADPALSRTGGPRFAKLRSALARQGAIVRGVSLLAGGTAVRQAIVLVAAPILTRLYAPSDFGVLAVFTSILGIGGVVAPLAYHLAIPLPGDEEEAVNLLALSLGLLLLGSGTLWLGLAVFRPGLTAWLRLEGGSSLFVLIGPTLALAGCYQSLSFWASRAGRFGVLARTRVYQGLGQDSLQIAGGLLGGGAPLLLFGYAVGQSVGIGSLARASPIPWGAVAWERIKRVAAKYSDFPRYSVWAGLANVGGLQIPPLLMAHLFGAATAGSFGLTVRVLALPSALIGQAVAQVYYPAAAARAERGEDVARLTKRLAVSLLAVGIPLFFPFVLFGRELFTALFSAKWVEAGGFAQPMAVWAIASLVSSPLSGLILVRGKQLPAMAVTTIEAALRLSAIWFGSRSGVPQIAVNIYAAVSVAISIGSLTWVLRMAKVRLVDLVRACRPLLAGGAGALVWWGIAGGRLPVLVVAAGVAASLAAGSTVTIRRFLPTHA